MNMVMGGGGTLPVETIGSGARFQSTMRQRSRPPDNRLSPMRGIKPSRGKSLFRPTTRFDEPKPNGKFCGFAQHQEMKNNMLTWRYFQNMTIPDFGDQLAREKKLANKTMEASPDNKVEAGEKDNMHH